jgi:hypothetical protein
MSQAVPPGLRGPDRVGIATGRARRDLADIEIVLDHLQGGGLTQAIPHHGHDLPPRNLVEITDHDEVVGLRITESRENPCSLLRLAFPGTFWAVAQ